MPVSISGPICVHWQRGVFSGQRRPSLLPVAQWLILAADRQGWGGITCPLPLAQHRKGKWNTAHAQKLPEGLCVSVGRGGEQVSCFPYCEIRSKNQAAVDPQQWILKWEQSSFIGHRRVLFRCTKCDFGITGFFITSLGLLKPHVLRFEHIFSLLLVGHTDSPAPKLTPLVIKGIT